MARETRIGIVLMMLLTGVFGFLVYRRWNSQQPTILAVASEIRDQVEAEDAQTKESQAKPEAVKETAEPSAEGKTDSAVPRPAAQQDNFFAKLGPPREEPDISAAEASSRPDPFATPAHLTGKVDEPAKPQWPSRNVSQKERVEVDPPASEDSSSPFDVPSSCFNKPVPSIGTAATKVPIAEATNPISPLSQPTPPGTAKTAGSEKILGKPTNPIAKSPVVPSSVKVDPFGSLPVALKEAKPEIPTKPVTPTKSMNPAVSATTVTSAETETSPFAGLDVENEPIADPPKPKVESSPKIATDPFHDNPFKEGNPSDPTGLGTEEPKAVTLKEDPFASFSQSATNKSTTKESNPFLIDSESEKESEPSSSFGQAPGPNLVDAAELDEKTPAATPQLKPPSSWTKASPFSTPASTAAKPSPPAAPVADETGPASPNLSDHNDALPIKIKDYVVRTHDNYWTISQSVYGSPIYAHALAQYNADLIPKPRNLKAGTKISVPPVNVLKERYAVLIATGSRSAARTEPRGGFFMTETGQPAYRVEESDTLKEIALSHLARSSRWIQIYEMNRDVIADPNLLKAGTVLKLPIDASRVKLVQDERLDESRADENKL